MGKKTRVLIQFEPEQLAELRKISEKTGAPVSELVRRAVSDYINLRAYIGAGSGYVTIAVPNDGSGDFSYTYEGPLGGGGGKEDK